MHTAYNRVGSLALRNSLWKDGQDWHVQIPVVRMSTSEHAFSPNSPFNTDIKMLSGAARHLLRNALGYIRCNISHNRGTLFSPLHFSGSFRVPFWCILHLLSTLFSRWSGISWLQFVMWSEGDEYWCLAGYSCCRTLFFGGGRNVHDFMQTRCAFAPG